MTQASSVSESSKLIDNARVVIYDHHMFIVQATVYHQGEQFKQSQLNQIRRLRNRIGMLKFYSLYFTKVVFFLFL
jgi:hypothetical protein